MAAIQQLIPFNIQLNSLNHVDYHDALFPYLLFAFVVVFCIQFVQMKEYNKNINSIILFETSNWTVNDIYQENHMSIPCNEINYQNIQFQRQTNDSNKSIISHVFFSFVLTNNVRGQNKTQKKTHTVHIAFSKLLVKKMNEGKKK